VEVREGDTVTQDLSAGTPERRSFYRVGRIEEDAVELVGSEKPGPVGECYLKYKL